MINIVEVATLGNQTIFIEKNKDGGFSVYKSMDNALLGIASPSLTAFYSQTELETMYLRSIRLNNQADPIAVIGQIMVHAEVNGWKAWIKPLEMAAEALRSPQPDPITGMVPCGCGGKLVLHKCSDREYMTTFYVECDNEECGLSVGRRYDPINHCRRGEFTDTKSAIEASNRAMGYIPIELSTPLPEEAQ